MKFGNKRLYINGELIDAEAKKTFELICPGNLEAIAQIAWASKSDTEKALDAAQKGFEVWSKTPVEKRVEWMLLLKEEILKKRDYLRESIMFEMGKVWGGTDEDLTSIANSLEFYANEIQTRSDIDIPDREGTHTHNLISQPLGVVVAFLAYNFPLLNLGFKLGPALAAGCSIIIKPSEFSPLSAYIIGEVCASINFPKGVINVICGDTQDVGIPLCESKIPRLITMIGSTETAQKLIGQSSKTSIKRYSMECGGNAPFIVCEDADLAQAINLGVALKVGNTGQICVAPNRFLIHSSLMEEFIKGMAKSFQEVKVGFGRENEPEMGPLANEGSVNKIEAIVKSALEQGAEVICGGRKLQREGYYFEPTVLKINNNESDVLQQEIFGPVAMICSFETKEEALSLANNTDAGLASYVFSKDEELISYFSENLEFGEVQVNGVKYDIYLPHGGIKNSGIGVDCSSYALDDYLIKKRVSRAIL